MKNSALVRSSSIIIHHSSPLPSTLSYNGGTTNSNTVTGEILDIPSSTKIAVMDDYTAKDDTTYVITLLNSGTLPLNGITITDDLGAYLFNETTLYPLAYT